MTMMGSRIDIIELHLLHCRARIQTALCVRLWTKTKRHQKSLKLNEKYKLTFWNGYCGWLIVRIQWELKLRKVEWKLKGGKVQTFANNSKFNLIEYRNSFAKYIEAIID